MPNTARPSIAACASPTRSSANVCPTTGAMLPTAASSQRGAGVAGQVRRGQLHRLDARDGDACAPGLVAIYLGEPSGRRPVCREPATGDGEREGGLTEPAADVVQHDVRATAELGPGLLRPVRVVAVHDRVGLELLDAGQLRGAGEGDDATGPGATELDRHDAEPAAGPDDQEAVCPTDRDDVEQAQCRGPVVEERGRGGQVEGVRHHAEPVGGDERAVGVSALVAGVAGDPPAQPGVVDVRSDPRHPPGDGVAGHVRRTHRPVVLSCAGPDGGLHPQRVRRLDVDQHLAGAGYGVRALDDLEHLRAAEPRHHCRSHPCSLRSPVRTPRACGLNRGSGQAAAGRSAGDDNGWSARGAPPVPISRATASDRAALW